MNILIYTHDFAPSIGGVQTIYRDTGAGARGCQEPGEWPARGGE